MCKYFYCSISDFVSKDGVKARDGFHKKTITKIEKKAVLIWTAFEFAFTERRLKSHPKLFHYC